MSPKLRQSPNPITGPQPKKVDKQAAEIKSSILGGGGSQATPPPNKRRRLIQNNSNRRKNGEGTSSSIESSNSQETLLENINPEHVKIEQIIPPALKIDSDSESDPDDGDEPMLSEDHQAATSEDFEPCLDPPVSNFEQNSPPKSGRRGRGRPRGQAEPKVKKSARAGDRKEHLP